MWFLSLAFWTSSLTFHVKEATRHLLGSVLSDYLGDLHLVFYFLLMVKRKVKAAEEQTLALEEWHSWLEEAKLFTWLLSQNRCLKAL